MSKVKVEISKELQDDLCELLRSRYMMYASCNVLRIAEEREKWGRLADEARELLEELGDVKSGAAPRVPQSVKTYYKLLNDMRAEIENGEK